MGFLRLIIESLSSGKRYCIIHKKKLLEINFPHTEGFYSKKFSEFSCSMQQTGFLYHINTSQCY